MEQTKVNVGINIESKKEAQRLGLSFSECLQFGLAFKAAEMEDTLYPSNLLSKRIETMAARLEEALRRIEELEAPKIGDKIYPEDFYGN